MARQELMRTIMAHLRGTPFKTCNERRLMRGRAELIPHCWCIWLVWRLIVGRHGLGVDLLPLR